MRGCTERGKLEQMDWEKVGGGTCHNDKPGLQGSYSRKVMRWEGWWVAVEESKLM